MFSSAMFFGRATQAASRPLLFPSNSSARRLFCNFPESSSPPLASPCLSSPSHSQSHFTPASVTSKSGLSSAVQPFNPSSSSSLSSSSSVLSSSCSSLFGSSARAFSTYKTTTGIVGVPVVENPHEVLIAIYEETLKRLSSYPKDAPMAAYNSDVQKLTAWRLKQVRSHSDVGKLEDAIGCGIIEQVINMAENELQLIIRLNESSWVADTVKACEDYARENPHWNYDPVTFFPPNSKTVKLEEYEKERIKASQVFWKDIDEEIRKEDEENAKKQAAQQNTNAASTPATQSTPTH